MQLGWYNGYSPQARLRHAAALKAREASGQLPMVGGTCQLCGDPDSLVEIHSEDYSLPPKLDPPAAYRLCVRCHRNHLHGPFLYPMAWAAFLAHVRRGGYARDLSSPEVRAELQAWRRSASAGQRIELKSLRQYDCEPGTEWFAQLPTSGDMQGMQAGAQVAAFKVTALA